MPAELVFIHGWGFDASFWDALCTRLPQFRQTRIDLGFFDVDSPLLAEGLRHAPLPKGKIILVGHSLGFAYGIRQNVEWTGWIAINGFARFVKTADRVGCVSAASVRDMRMRLKADAQKTLQDFHALADAPTSTGVPNAERLREGLDELRSTDVEGIMASRDIPGLVLAGGRDPLVPMEASEKLAIYAKNGSIRMQKEGGHLLPQTDPAWCAEAIAGFVNGNFNDA